MLSYLFDSWLKNLIYCRPSAIHQHFWLGAVPVLSFDCALSRLTCSRLALCLVFASLFRRSTRARPQELGQRVIFTSPVIQSISGLCFINQVWPRMTEDFPVLVR